MKDLLAKNNARNHGKGHYSVSDERKGWTIHIYEGAKHPDTGGTFLWKVDGQYFSDDRSAVRYLIRLIAERNTGIRLIDRVQGKIPEMCGIGRGFCKAIYRGYFTMLCYTCPVAEHIQAERDGVELLYAQGPTVKGPTDAIDIATFAKIKLGGDET